MNSSGSRPALIFLLFLLAVWHGWPFTVGYRLTADSVWFLDTLLQGPDEVWETTKMMAEGHGRIGFYALMPLNMAGSYLSESDAWRGLFVALYIGVVALSFAYASRLLKSTFAPLAFLVWLVLHPLLFDHTPPTSYPLQNTLPFLLLIGTRFYLHEREPRGPLLWLSMLVQACAMLLTEFAILFGLVLIGGETLVRHPIQWRSLLTWFNRLFRDQRTQRDLLLLAVVVGAYLIYRLIHGGDYEGVQINPVQSFSALAYTTFFHVVEGLSLARFDSRLWEAPLEAWGLATVAGFVLSLASFWALRQIKKPLPSFSIVTYMLLSILVVTLPLSLTAKQQHWCVNNGQCAYLDSRVSILGVVLICVALLSYLPLQRRAVSGCIAGLLGLAFTANSVHNWQVSRDMRPYAIAWERAQMLSCAPDLIPTTDQQRRYLIDPDGLVLSNQTFWQKYMSAARAWTDCDPDHPVLKDATSNVYLPDLKPGEIKRVQKGEPAVYLGTGWSHPAATGVWTDGEEAKLHFTPDGVDHVTPLSLILHGHIFLDDRTVAQRMVVRQKGEIIWEATIGKDGKPSCCTFEIPLLSREYAGEDVILTLSFPDAAAPYQKGDPRKLGLFLGALEIRAE